jgi:cysteine-rich repeat protein
MNRQPIRTASALLACACAWSAGLAQETIHFEGLEPGAIVNQVLSDMGSGPILVDGANPLLAGQNAAVIFDSAAPTGDDCDLGTPNMAFGGPGCGRKALTNDTALGNILILDTDLDPIDGMSGLVTNPDDLDCSNMSDGDCAAIPGANATITFDFGALGSVTLESLTLVDADGISPNPRVELYDGEGNLLSTVPLPTTNPNNGVASVDLGSTSGVATMVVYLQGSGAIDNVVFIRDVACGDGILDEGEECDDGNTASGDGCSSDCRNEDDEDDDEIPDEGDDENGDPNGDDEDDEQNEVHHGWW